MKGIFRDGLDEKIVGTAIKFSSKIKKYLSNFLLTILIHLVCLLVALFITSSYWI